jgi:hypothetical protein
MAYHIYARSGDIAAPTYTFVKDTCLFGRNSSEILRLLRVAGIPTGQGEPWLWGLNVRDAFAKDCHADWSFIIDLRPGSTDFDFYELLEVYGYTKGGWTPYLLRLRSVLNMSAGQEARPPKTFPLDQEAFKDTVCTLGHFRDASVKNGQLEGQWNVPGRGNVANSTLLWPHEWDYFCQCNQKPLGP